MELRCERCGDWTETQERGWGVKPYFLCEPCFQLIQDFIEYPDAWAPIIDGELLK